MKRSHLGSSSIAATAATAAIATIFLFHPGTALGFLPPNGADMAKVAGFDGAEVSTDHRMTLDEAKRAASRDPKISRYIRRFGGVRITGVFKDDSDSWEVNVRVGDDEVARALVHDSDGKVTEAWTGPQVAWSMARGIEGAFGRKVTKAWIWIPLMVLFVLPFLDFRRPLRWLHLDLLALLAFSVSLFYFNRAEIESSVPLTYPVLGYLLLRMLAVALRSKPVKNDPLKLLVPVTWLALGVVFLVGFRVALNIIDSNVIDVGYAGAIGADRISHAQPIYGNFPDDNPSGDTYGPLNYLVYLPFEFIFPWKGSWDDVPAAHGAAIFFDLATIVALFFVGRSLARGSRGTKLGVALSYAWAAYPFTLYASNSNSNDSIQAFFLVIALLALARPALRGVFLGAASLIKFAPIALVPLWASYPKLWSRPREKVAFALGFAGVVVFLMLPSLINAGPESIWEKTLGYQATRGSPFSIWGLHPVRLDIWQEVARGAVAACAVVAAFLPRVKSPTALVALSAGLVIASVMTITHWFYLYIVWFFPLVIVALFARPVAGATEDADRGDAGGSNVEEPAPGAHEAVWTHEVKNVAGGG